MYFSKFSLIFIRWWVRYLLLVDSVCHNSYHLVYLLDCTIFFYYFCTCWRHFLCSALIYTISSVISSVNFLEISCFISLLNLVDFSFGIFSQPFIIINFLVIIFNNLYFYIINIHIIYYLNAEQKYLECICKPIN